jgi:hypothetical protein
MSSNQQALAAYTSAAVGGGTDPNFANVVFLSHFDGTNGGTTFTDVKGKTITRNGSILLSNTHFKYGTTAAKFISASSQYLNVATSSDFTLGTGDWTIECWVYLDTSAGGSTQYLFDMRPNSTSGTYAEIGIDSSGNLRFQVNGSQQIASSANEFNTLGTALNVWAHVAACKASGSTKLFLQGTQVGSTYSDSNNYQSAAELFIGASSFLNSFFNGWMDDFRMTKGFARYTANFTPSAFAFPDS